MSTPRPVNTRLAHGLISIASSFYIACAVDDPRASGVVLLDREAVESQASLLQDGTGQSAASLPILVVPDDPVELRNATSAQVFSVGSGELVWVRGGSLGVSRFALGREVDRGRLELVAPHAIADDFAALMSAEVIELEPEQFELRIADAFIHLAQMAPDEVLEVRPLPLEAGVEIGVAQARLPPNTLGALRGLDDGRPIALPAVAPDVALGFDPVGIYRCGDAQLVLDAAGRFNGCGLRSGARGAYRVEGGVVTLESASGATRFQLADDGVLIDPDGLRCAIGGEP